jgi:hypothetical protein
VRVLEHVGVRDEGLREVEDAVERSRPRVAADELVVAVERLAEHEEVGLALGTEALARGGREDGPEVALDVLDRVDAVAVEVDLLDPAREGVDEGGPHLRELRCDVLETAGEVAERALGDVVEPVVLRVGTRCTAPDVAHTVVRAGCGEERRVRGKAIDARVVEEQDRSAAAEAFLAVGEDAARLPRRVVLADLHDGVARAATSVHVVVGAPVAIDVVEEDLAHVIDHDVEHDLHPAVVRLGDHRAQRPEVAEVGIELGEVLLPVTVVARVVRVAVDVLDNRRDPQRGDAEGLQVIEVLGDAQPIAALVLIERSRLDVEVVVHVPIREAVDDELVNHLVAPVLHVRGERRLLSFRRHADAPRLGRDGGTEGEQER